MAQTKPAWGKTGIVDFTLPEAVLGQILKQLPFDLNPESEVLLLDACERFMADHEIYPLPGGSNVKAALMTIKKRIVRSGPKRLPAILEMIRNLDTVSRSMIVTQESSLDLNQLLFHLELSDSPIEDGLFNKELMDFQLEQLDIAVNAALETLNKRESRRGPRTNIAITSFICKLSKLYESATGNRARSGIRHDGEDTSGSQFFIFVDNCLSFLGCPHHSPVSLGRYIDEVTK